MVCLRVYRGMEKKMATTISFKVRDSRLKGVQGLELRIYYSKLQCRAGA